MIIPDEKLSGFVIYAFFLDFSSFRYFFCNAFTLLKKTNSRKVSTLSSVLGVIHARQHLSVVYLGCYRCECTCASNNTQLSDASHYAINHRKSFLEDAVMHFTELVNFCEIRIFSRRRVNMRTLSSDQKDHGPSL